MIKIDLTTKLKNLKGEPVTDNDGNEVPIGKVMANALISVDTTQDPTKNYILSTKLYQQDEIELSAEDFTYLKTQLNEAGKKGIAGGYMFPVLYKGQILDILEKADKGESAKDDKKKE